MRILLLKRKFPIGSLIVISEFIEYFNNYLIDGSLSPYSKIMNLRIYGISIVGSYYLKPTYY